MAPLGWKEPPELGPGEVHLWWGRVSAAGPCDPAPAPLSTDEEERARRFHREVHRDRFRWRRAFLRRLLAAYLGATPAELRFELGEHGKPRLAGVSWLEFNLSHSGDEVLIGVARGRALGVDVQLRELRTEVGRVARQVLSPEEQAAFEALPEEQRAQAFFRVWARKEALLKTTGSGLSLDPTRFSVGVRSTALSRPTPVDALSPDGPLGFLDLVPPDFTAAACVASHGTDWTVRQPQSETAG